MVPSSLQGFAGPIASQLPITPFNLVCTNVPGPQFPLYLLGHKMLDWYPYVPVGGEMAVNCAILSYNGKVYFGFSGDIHAAPDLSRMEKLLMASFIELRDSAGIKPSHKKRARQKRKVARNAGARSVPLTSAEPSVRESKRAPDVVRTDGQENSAHQLVVA